MRKRESREEDESPLSGILSLPDLLFLSAGQRLLCGGLIQRHSLVQAVAA